MRLRLADIAAAGAILAAVAGPCAPAGAATINAQAKAKVIKPLAIQSLQDLDFGSVMLGPGTWSGATVRLSRTGALTCPALLACSGATQVARYNVAGTNNQTVTISAPDITLTNQADSTKTLTLVVDSPGTVVLTNSGPPGTNFNIAGSITLTSATATGTYVGTFNVSAEYQ